MTLKHGFQMWQLNIPNPWEISSVGFVFGFFFFPLFITKCPLPFFMLSLPSCLSVSLCTAHYSKDCCALVLTFSWGRGGTIISSLAVAAEQCKVSLHLILVTKRYWTAVCWVPLDIHWIFHWISSVHLCGCLRMLMHLCTTRAWSVKCHFGKNVQFWPVKFGGLFIYLVLVFFHSKYKDSLTEQSQGEKNKKRKKTHKTQLTL